MFLSCIPIALIGIQVNNLRLVWLSSRNFFRGGGGQNLLYADLFCYTNVSIVFGPIFRGGGANVSEKGQTA